VFPLLPTSSFLYGSWKEPISIIRQPIQLRGFLIVVCLDRQTPKPTCGLPASVTSTRDVSPPSSPRYHCNPSPSPLRGLVPFQLYVWYTACAWHHEQQQQERKRGSIDAGVQNEFRPHFLRSAGEDRAGYGHASCRGVDFASSVLVVGQSSRRALIVTGGNYMVTWPIGPYSVHVR
jgi:hypothetical protein